MPTTSASRAARPSRPGVWLWLFIGLAWLVAACTPPVVEQAVDGELDLTEWTSDHSIVLQGDWTAARGLDIRWIDTPLGDEGVPHHMEVPWDDIVGDRFGCATFQLRVRLPEEPQTYGFFLQYAGTSYELWANGERVIQKGHIACERDATVPDFGFAYGETELAGDTLITLRSSNFWHEPGGPLIAPHFGRPEVMQRNSTQRDFFNMFTIGGLLFIGLYHLIVWLMRREDAAGLWFGLLCMDVVVRLPNMEFFLQRSTDVTGFSYTPRISYFTLYFGLPALLWYMEGYRSAPWFRGLAYFVSGFSLVFVATVLSPGVEQFVSVLPYYQLLVVVVGVAMIGRSIQMLFERAPGAGYVFFSIMVFFVAAAHDISINRGGPGFGVDLVQYALLAFMMSQSVAIARRFANAYHTTDHLSQHLKEEVDKQTRQLQALLQQERALMGALASNNSDLIATRDELQVALQEAHRAAEAKSAFLANMSHELRTPLNGVIGMSEILSLSELSDDQLGLIATLQSSGDALLTIISDILDFSKIDSGELDVQRVAFDVNEIVENVVHLLAPKAEQEGLSIGALFETSVPERVIGDPGRLSQILTNLVGNALKFTDEGEVVTHVGLVEQTDKSVVLRFEVTDTGVGIPLEQQQRLFEAFEQADLSTTRHYGGTGLGLAITRELIHRLGGELGVTSVVGVGSTFWFELPYEIDAETEPVVQTAELAGCRALLVDDNPTNLRVLEGLLHRWQVETVSVTRAEEALRALSSEHPFDIVLLDFQMPDMDGLETVIRLRELPGGQDLPVVLLTSIALHRHARRAEAAGVMVRVTKPVRRSVLAHAMYRAMGFQNPSDSLLWDSTQGSYPPQEGRVLVVDDNAVNRDVISRLVGGFGYTVQSAEDGQSALQVLETQRFDAILMDCQMPVLDGYETTRTIRAREEGDPVPVIAVTAAGTSRDRERAWDSGMDDWIQKPVRRQTLFEVLLKWIPQDGLTDEAIAAMERQTDKELEEVPVVESGKLPPEDELLDLMVVDGLLAVGDAEFFAELLDEFEEDAAQELATLRDALSIGDTATAARRAHSLKGMAANLGAKTLADHAAELDDACRSGDVPASWDDGQLRWLLERSLVALRIAFGLAER